MLLVQNLEQNTQYNCWWLVVQSQKKHPKPCMQVTLHRNLFRPKKYAKLKATEPQKWLSTVQIPSLLVNISMERGTWEEPGSQVSCCDDGKVTLDHQDVGQHPASSCLDRSEILENVFEQLRHWYFLMSECVCRWARRFERSANARLQWGHENGFSPETTVGQIDIDRQKES